MTTSIVIGSWIVPLDYEFRRCPSYYAADWEVLRVKAGNYPARITFHSAGSYPFPMPQYLQVELPCTRVGGRLYSGFGGLNFSSTELSAGVAVPYTDQSYSYEIGRYAREGRLTLLPGFDWLIGDAGTAVWEHPDAPKTWDDVRKLREPEQIAEAEARAATME